jgi:uncharacterized membrane protein
LSYTPLEGKEDVVQGGWTVMVLIVVLQIVIAVRIVIVEVRTVINSFIKEIITLNIIPCHRKKERSLIIKGKQIPLCYRCMCILIGYLFLPIILILQFDFPLWLGIILNGPMVLDGATQRMGIRVSNNLLRSITGLLSGAGQSIIIVNISQFLFEFISKS